MWPRPRRPRCRRLPAPKSVIDRHAPGTLCVVA
jgi:hypothetical protein